MATALNRYQPDYGVPPGQVLEEWLTAEGIPQAEFARRCGRSAKLISEIIAGKAPVEPRTALQFEKVLGMDAGIWLGIEADYRLHLGREAEAREAEASAAWAKAFPVNALARRGAIPAPRPGGEAVSALLAFFGVASIAAWRARHDAARVAWRRSPSFKGDPHALAAWLRLAEIEAGAQARGSWREPAFREALGRMRRLTRSPLREALAEAPRLCNEAGVALAFVAPLPKAPVSGAAWWLAPGRPVIALSGRHGTDDQLWFSFFHEAAHLLIHSKKAVFIDEAAGSRDRDEDEAEDWAADFLAPRRAWRRFVERAAFDEASVRGFAADLEIAPGIVVGRLQHDRLIPWRSRLNGLKARLAAG